MGQKKILIDGTPLIAKHLSGVGQVILETIRCFDSRAYEKEYRFTIFLPSDERGKLDYLNLKYIKIVYLPYPHKLLSLFSRMSFAPPLDLFLGRGTYLFMNFRNWNLAKSTSITYVHDVAFLKYPEFIEPRNLRFLSRHITMWIRRSTTLIAVSHATASEIKKELPFAAEKVRTIANAVNTSLFRPQAAPVLDAIKQKYDLTDYLLFVGNIEPRKNLITLIDAFKKSAQKGEVQLFIVGGDGWLNEPIDAAIEQARREGYGVKRNDTYVPDEDLPGLMQAARSVVVPSWHEGFGLPVLQTIASGGKVIASDIPALREAVNLAEADNVQFFDPADSSQLAQCLKKAQDTPATAIGYVRQWSEAVDELLKLIDDVEEKR